MQPSRKRADTGGLSQDMPATGRITNAIARMFIERGDACLREFTLKSGRRVDVIALAKDGEIIIVEVKSSRQDFLSDGKWQDYLEWADRFYFAVADSFPRDLPGAGNLRHHHHRRVRLFRVAAGSAHETEGGRRTHMARRLAHVAMRRLEFGLENAAIEGGVAVPLEEEDAAGILPA